MTDSIQTPPPPGTCARCQKTLSVDDRVAASDRVFCRSCYETLTFELKHAVARMSEDVNYPMAALGALLGGVVGVLIWWGFTVLTQVGFGLIAVAIGFLVGHGAVYFTSGKRSRGLQILSVVVGALSFFVAAYLVNMTFLNQALAQRGAAWRVPFPPLRPTVFYWVLSMNFGVMKLVFLAVVIYEAWRIPQPPKLPVPA